VRRIANFGLFAFGIVTAVVGSACGSSEMSLSPTAPSSITTSAGAVISGRVNGVTAAATSMDTFSTMESHALTVGVVGTNISTTINGSGQFTLSGVPAGTVQLKFSGTGVDATVTLSGVTTTDRIDITVTVTGGNARLESERRGNGNGDTEVTGAVSGLTGACPTVTFTVQNTRVTTSSTTAFSDTTCARVANGMRVEVKGARQSDGSIAASRVEAEDDDEDRVNARAELNGPVASLGGGCPAVSFIVQGTRVTANTATLFDDITCATLANGVQVEVEGQRQADGSVLASRVEGKVTNSREQRMQGLVSVRAGTCPAITFSVQGANVTTTSATRFKDVSCANVVNGMRVEVRGQRQTDGSVLASRVEPEDDDDADDDEDED
jgi:Domain of unknown function (DUF5666)